MNKPKHAALLLLLHQPYRITDTSQFETANLDEVFIGNYNKDSYQSSNQQIFERVAQNSYIPTAQFWLRYLENHPDFCVNFTFSGTFLEQCRQYPQYGKQIIDLFRALVATGRVGIAAETYYHSICHMYSWEEFARQIEAHRILIKETFGIWPKYFRNTESQMNNQIAEFVRLMGFDSTSAPGLYKNLKYNEVAPCLKTIERHRFDTSITKSALSHNTTKYTPRYMTIAPLDHLVSDMIFNLKNFQEKKQEFKSQISDSTWEFHLLFNDFEALGEHNNSHHGNIYESMEEYIELFAEENISFLTLDQLPSYADYTRPNYDLQYDVSSGNANQDLESWRGNYYQEMAFIKLVELHNTAARLYDSPDPRSQELLGMYRKLTTSDHFYYLADIPGPVGEVHKMFSPFNSVEQAFKCYCDTIDKVESAIDNHLEKFKVYPHSVLRY